MSSVIENQKKRFVFLNKLYEITGGNRFVIANMWEIGQSLQFSRGETDLVMQYLTGEGLAKHETMGGGIAITHEGVLEIERAVSNPEKSTQYFPPVVNIINIREMSNSQIQQGTNNSTQKADFSPIDIDNIKTAINDIKSRLDGLNLDRDDFQEASAQIATMEAQLAAKKPNQTIVGECIKTLRNIVEGSVGSVIASEVLQPLLHILCK